MGRKTGFEVLQSLAVMNFYDPRREPASSVWCGQGEPVGQWLLGQTRSCSRSSKLLIYPQILSFRKKLLQLGHCNLL